MILKHFIGNSIPGKLFTLKIKSKYPPLVKSYGTSAVCYLKNFYTLSDKYGKYKRVKVDKHAVETSSFQYENSLLPSLWTKIIRGRPFSLNDRFDLCRIILDFKKRNPSFASVYTDPGLVERSMSKVVSQAKDSFQPIWNETSPDGNTYGEVMENVEEISREMMSDINNRVDLYRESLLKSDIVSKTMHENACVLSISSIVIYKNFTSTPFITNDNPGFVILEDGSAENINMKDWSFYVFPLTPNYLCMISKQGSDPNRIGHSRSLVYEDATETVINTVNLVAIRNCNQMIISNDNLVLERSLKHRNQLLK